MIAFTDPASDHRAVVRKCRPHRRRPIGTAPLVRGGFSRPDFVRARPAPAIGSLCLPGHSIGCVMAFDGEPVVLNLGDLVPGEARRVSNRLLEFGAHSRSW